MILQSVAKMKTNNYKHKHFIYLNALQILLTYRLIIIYYILCVCLAHSHVCIWNTETVFFVFGKNAYIITKHCSTQSLSCNARLFSVKNKMFKKKSRVIGMLVNGDGNGLKNLLTYAHYIYIVYYILCVMLNVCVYTIIFFDECFVCFMHSYPVKRTRILCKTMYKSINITK